MGVSASRLAEVAEHDAIITDKFRLFVEECCVQGPDRFSAVFEMEAAFAFFLQRSGSTVGPRGDVIETSSACVVQLCRKMDLGISPGWTTHGLDTRHIVGIAVVRFQKA